jgi:DNA primase
MLEEAVAAYQEAVTGEVASYLVGRGIGRAEAATFRLGYVADPQPGHSYVRGRLCIPYLGHDGHPLMVRFRCLRPHDHKDKAVDCPKYMTLAGDESRMFNVRAIHEAGSEIHLTEGELDAVILTKIGLHAVAIPGVHNWKGRHRRMLAGFSRIWTWADPDDAGSDLTNTVTRALPAAKPVRLREADVTDTFMKYGAQHLLDLIKPKESEAA